MEPRISIIVPVYKVEKYLDKCVQSVINQTYGNIEIILVDDGSPDACPAMCDNYAKQDSRIRVIHKSNGGLSDARNAGIREALADYLLFVDSDDFIDLDTCERFIRAMGNYLPDIVVGNARKVEAEEVSVMQHRLNTVGQVITGEQYLKAELKTGTMYMAAWLNLYNRAFLLNNGLEFKVGLLHEDEQFTPRVFLKATVVIGIDIIFYNYLIRDGSITKNRDRTKNGIHIVQTCYELSKIYESLKDKALKRLLLDVLVTKYLYGFQIGRLNRKEYDELINKGFLLRRASSPRTRYKAILFSINKKMYYWLNQTIKQLSSRQP